MSNLPDTSCNSIKTSDRADPWSCTTQLRQLASERSRRGVNKDGDALHLGQSMQEIYTLLPSSNASDVRWRCRVVRSLGFAIGHPMHGLPLCLNPDHQSSGLGNGRGGKAFSNAAMRRKSTSSWPLGATIQIPYGRVFWSLHLTVSDGTHASGRPDHPCHPLLP